MNHDRTSLIEDRLRQAFDPLELLVKDQSHLHAGHDGARDGRGHFDVTIVSTSFQDLSRIQRHRSIYDSLGELMQTDIHALRIRAYTPGER